MKIPYGISNFRSLREESYLYIDKTKYIEILEKRDAKYLFFIRPRRFGKSLFLSTLAYYYDIKEAHRFDSLFGDLYIGQDPTERKNQYLLLELDFSGLNTENKESLLRSFMLRLKIAVQRFVERYEEYFKDVQVMKNQLERIEDVSAILKMVITEVQQTDKKMYLIIDEYDHFANDIITMGDGTFYKDIIRASGFVRDFYETIKIGTKSVIDRIFITGISPIMLDDLTSGFNIAANITLDEQLNEMLGFTLDELEEVMEKRNIKSKLKVLSQTDVSLAVDGSESKNGVRANTVPLTEEKLLEELQNNYNGYLFHPKGKKRVYNPDMILSFFDAWEITGEYPEHLISDNVKSDYGRMQRLASNEKNKKTLYRIIEEENISADIVTRVSFDRMYDEDYFVSLLFYMGLLTIKGKKYGKTVLGIPNYVILKVFWEYIEKNLRVDYGIEIKTEALAKAIWDIGFHGTIEPFIEYISENVLQKLSNRDLIRFDEKYIKVLLFAYLTTSNLYRPISEREVEEGYMDIYLERDVRMPDVQYEWILELKYVKEDQRGQLDKIREKGLEQLKAYRNSTQFAQKKNLKTALLLFIGKGEYEVIQGDSI